MTRTYVNENRICTKSEEITGLVTRKMVFLCHIKEEEVSELYSTCGVRHKIECILDESNMT